MNFKDILVASKEGTLEDVKYLVEKELVDINIIEKGCKNTPLIYAVGWNKENSEPITDYLVSRGADVNAKNCTGLTPLHSAMSRKSFAVIQCLVSNGADVNAIITDNEYKGETPIFKAAIFNQDIEVFKLLISKGANVNVRSEGKVYKGLTLLHKIASDSKYCNADACEIIKLLISNGADVNAKTVGLFAKSVMQLANTDAKKKILQEAGAI